MFPCICHVHDPYFYSQNFRDTHFSAFVGSYTGTSSKIDHQLLQLIFYIKEIKIVREEIKLH